MYVSVNPLELKWLFGSCISCSFGTETDSTQKETLKLLYFIIMLMLADYLSEYRNRIEISYLDQK